MLSLDSLDTDCLTAEEQLSQHNAIDLKKTQFLPAAEVSS